MMILAIVMVAVVVEEVVVRGKKWLEIVEVRKKGVGSQGEVDGFLNRVPENEGKVYMRAAKLFILSSTLRSYTTGRVTIDRGVGPSWESSRSANAERRSPGFGLDEMPAENGGPWFV
ncbi:hypothetical protein F4861DRAFT_501247 [Xylaria intraflava]|nr:hypothetical protein F4861DRAFT_501247 [Xylaria intraflava]